MHVFTFTLLGFSARTQKLHFRAKTVLRGVESRGGSDVHKPRGKSKVADHRGPSVLKEAQLREERSFKRYQETVSNLTFAGKSGLVIIQKLRPETKHFGERKKTPHVPCAMCHLDLASRSKVILPPICMQEWRSL